MRQYIFDFEQEIVVKLGLSVNELLILDYLIKFFDSGSQHVLNINGKKYAWINYKKLLSDLPILNICERAMRNIFIKLEKNNIIERKVLDRKMFIYINRHKLYYNSDRLGYDYLTTDDENQLKTYCGIKIPQNDQNGKICEFKFRLCGIKVPPIVNYYKNKIKILLDDKRVKNIVGERFLFLLKGKLKGRISEINYDICIKTMKVVVIAENIIVLNGDATDILKLNTKGEFYNCLCEVLDEVLSDINEY